jgi:hypothetical protein
MKSYQLFYKLLIQDPAWKESSTTKVCLMAMISIAARDNGAVDAAYSHIAHISGVSVTEARLAFEKLEKLGTDSHFRLVRDGMVWHFPGFKRLNRLVLTGEMNGAPIRSTSRGIGGYVYYAVLGNKVKIGFSMNPWSRVRELGNVHKGIKLVAHERGTYAREKHRHRQFEAFNLHGEWFELRDELQSHIKNIQSTKRSLT